MQRPLDLRHHGGAVGREWHLRAARAFAGLADAASRQSERGRRSCGVSAPINRGWRSCTCTASRRRACWAKRCTTWTGSGPSSWRFLDNGIWPLDSNPAENAIRPFVVGRRRWLFADTVGGANRSANLYSLIETAKGNNVEPYRHLVALFKKLPLAQTADDYEALLQW
ncbi:IS66 family transposase [Variovorax sp. RB2P76]|uniref:IS66 family transposase n=1 Tax=Variovorax sp. RB2P76 TaxID=3443736 RepID=UPI003F44A2FB